MSFKQGLGWSVWVTLLPGAGGGQARGQIVRIQALRPSAEPPIGWVPSLPGFSCAKWGEAAELPRLGKLVSFTEKALFCHNMRQRPGRRKIHFPGRRPALTTKVLARFIN